MSEKEVAIGAIENNNTDIWIAFDLTYERIELVDSLRIY